jgi:hypothetical protein
MPNAILAASVDTQQQFNQLTSTDQRVSVQDQNGASKSIFNHTYKELKPSKSVDLTSSLVDGLPNGSVGGTVNSMVNEDNDNLDLYLFRPSEKVEQVACGAIHTMIRTNLNRLFSCGNGSTFALGHASKESCNTFRQIEFFNSSASHLSSSGENPCTYGLQNVTIKTIACGLSHSGCVTGEGDVFVWGLTGEVQGKPNLETLLEKCLFKRPTQVSFKHCLERDSS